MASSHMNIFGLYNWHTTSPVGGFTVMGWVEWYLGSRHPDRLRVQAAKIAIFEMVVLGFPK